MGSPFSAASTPAASTPGWGLLNWRLSAFRSWASSFCIDCSSSAPCNLPGAPRVKRPCHQQFPDKGDFLRACSSVRYKLAAVERRCLLEMVIANPTISTVSLMWEGAASSAPLATTCCPDCGSFPRSLSLERRPFPPGVEWHLTPNQEWVVASAPRNFTSCGGE